VDALQVPRSSAPEARIAETARVARTVANIPLNLAQHSRHSAGAQFTSADFLAPPKKDRCDSSSERRFEKFPLNEAAGSASDRGMVPYSPRQD